MGLLKLSSAYSSTKKKLPSSEGEEGPATTDETALTMGAQRGSTGEGGIDLIGIESDSSTTIKLQIDTSVPTISNLGPVSIDIVRRFIGSSNPSTVYTILQNVRKLLSVETSPPYRDFIKAGLLADCTNILKHNRYPQILLETAWSISNVASGSTDDTKAVINSDAAIELVKLMRCDSSRASDESAPIPHLALQEQCAWALGNIAGDSVTARNYVLGLRPPVGATLIELIRCCPPSSPSVARTSIWTLSNLLRGKPPPPPEIVDVSKSFLLEMVSESVDQTFLGDAVWALSYATESSDTVCHMMATNTMVVRKLVSFVKSQGLTRQSLRCIGNLLSGGDFETQAVINAGGIPMLVELLQTHPRREIRREACWSLSNIAAGNNQQIQALLDQSVFSIVRPLMHSEEADLAKDAMYCITNVFVSGNDVQVRSNSSIGIFEELCHILSKPLISTAITAAIVMSLQAILLNQQRIRNIPQFYDDKLREIVVLLAPVVARAQSRVDMFQTFQTLSNIFNVYMAPHDSSLVEIVPSLRSS